MPSSQIPTVALIGRTNVGKSTLFNRMLEQPKALVSNVAGTTRDRNEGRCLWRGMTIRLIDTGGFFVGKNKDVIEEGTIAQAKLAMKQADLILFVVDAKTGPMPHDLPLAEMLNKAKVPVIVVANKAETYAERMNVEQVAWNLKGLPHPFSVSATRGTGVGDLLDLMFDTLTNAGHPPNEYAEVQATRLAVIGKPNVGKSSLLNAIMGEERFITSPIAHTTREPNDTLVHVGEKKYILIDTAGMRKSNKVRQAGGLEEAAVKRNEGVVRIADVTLLIVDATEPLGTQEKTLAGFLKDSRSGIIVVVNKWDLVEDKTTRTMNEYRKYVAGSIPFLQFAPVIFVSALTKQRVKTIFDLVEKVQVNRTRWIPEKELQTFLRQAIAGHKPMRGTGTAAPKVLGLKQVNIEPPTFDLIVKAKRLQTLSDSYVRYLSNRLHSNFDLEGTSVRIHIRQTRSVSS